MYEYTETIVNILLNTENMGKYYFPKESFFDNTFTRTLFTIPAASCVNSCLLSSLAATSCNYQRSPT